MIKGSTLIARLPKICIICKKDYLSKQANSSYCNECRISLTEKVISCKCGCGKLLNRKNTSGYFRVSCILKGKSYKEVYGNNLPKFGFKKGLENPNYTSKIFQRFKLSSPNKSGRLFRSSLEADFSDLLSNNGIRYNYEVRVPLINGKLKVVDFVIPSSDGGIYVEITGYSYNKWQRDFDSKFRVLKQTLQDQPILILTYPDKLQLVRSNNRDRNVFFSSIYNREDILEKITFFRSILFLNKNILNETVNN